MTLKFHDYPSPRMRGEVPAKRGMVGFLVMRTDNVFPTWPFPPSTFWLKPKAHFPPQGGEKSLFRSLKSCP